MRKMINKRRPVIYMCGSDGCNDMKSEQTVVYAGNVNL